MSVYAVEEHLPFRANTTADLGLGFWGALFVTPTGSGTDRQTIAGL